MNSKSNLHISATVAAGAALWLSACADSSWEPIPRRTEISDVHALAAAALVPKRPALKAGLSVTLAASRAGAVAVPLDDIDAVLAELAAGHPVVLGQALHAPIVAAGYDLDRDTLVLLAEPPKPHTWPLAEWREDWRSGERWAVALMPPGDLPARADAHTYLRAASRLGQASSPWEAVLAYDAGLARWPGNVDGLAGLGISLYDLGDFQGAADAFADAMTASRNSDERERVTRLAARINRGRMTAQPVSATEKDLSEAIGER